MYTYGLCGFYICHLTDLTTWNISEKTMPHFKSGIVWFGAKKEEVIAATRSFRLIIIPYILNPA